MSNTALKTDRGGVRDSSIELFRIITMLVIVAHHYYVNSGLSGLVNQSPELTGNAIFLLLFGWGGKTGINCFVLITGYFMCKSKITLKKFLKLVLWMEFYRILLFLIFTISGYQSFTIRGIVMTLLPINSISDGFGSAYLAFYLFIPFLNLLINAMNKRQHILLMMLCLFVYTVLATLNIKVVFNYVTWFCVIYIIGSYIRLYPEKWFDSKKVWGFAALISLALSWASIIALEHIFPKISSYYFVSDSNKILAVATAVCAFMFFKNLNIGYSRFINTVAASAYGVLLIHANSDSMRKWLWKDTLNNVGMYNSPWLPVHAICSVLGIYVICTIIDMLRRKFLEKPFFKLYDKWYDTKIAKIKRITEE